jgi:PilZ domain
VLHRANSNPAPEPGAGAPSDRRSDVRRQCCREAYCQPGSTRPDNLWWLAMIQDVSQTGLEMLSTRRYEPDAVMTIRLRGPTGRFICTGPARVVHIRKRSEGGWHIG